MVGCKDLSDLKAAQFIMGPELYCEFIWRERAKASKPVPQSKMRVPFKWRSAEVIELSSKRKK